MKTQKNLTEMTTTELREEIGRLSTELNRVHTKNKRRRKALKEMNRNALVNFKLRGDLQGEVRYLRQSVRLLTDTLEHYKNRPTKTVDTTPRKKSFLQRIGIVESR